MGPFPVCFKALDGFLVRGAMWEALPSFDKDYHHACVPGRWRPYILVPDSTRTQFARSDWLSVVGGRQMIRQSAPTPAYRLSLRPPASLASHFLAHTSDTTSPLGELPSEIRTIWENHIPNGAVI